jgi:hypothetical protein
MAEKVIGLRIQLNGLNTVITDIKTLENEIRKAKEDLKEVEIGGDIFNQLAREISQAETKLIGLQDAAKGISKEKTLEGFGKLGAGISSSFAAATAAVSLFGKESESVQKAATQAQNLLTIALSIRGIAEVKTGAQIVAKTIAEKASTAATLATNAATKALYTTMAANPFGVILVVVGALVTAYLTLTSATYDAEAAQESYNKTLENTIAQFDLERTEIQANLALKLKTAELEGASIEQIADLRKKANLDSIDLIDRQAKDLVRLRIERQKEISQNIKDEKEKNAAIRKLTDDFTKEGRRLGLERFKLEQQIKLDEIDLEIQQNERRKKNSADRAAALEKEIELLGQRLELETKLSTMGYKIGQADSKIVETGKNRVQGLKELKNVLTDILPFEEQFNLKLQETFGTLRDIAIDELQSLTKAFDFFSESAGKVGITRDELKKQQDNINNATAKFIELNKDYVSPETITQVQKLSSNLVLLSETLFNISNAKIEPPFNIGEFRTAFKELAQLESETTIFSPEKAAQIRITAQQQQDRFVAAYVQYIKTTASSVKEQNKILNDPKLLPADKTKELQKLDEQYKKIGLSLFENTKNVVLENEKFNIGIGVTAEQVKELNVQLTALKNDNEALAAFIIQNRELFANAYDVDLTKLAENRTKANQIILEVGKKTYDKERKFQQDVLDFEEKLKKKGVDISKLTYEQKLELLKDALEKEVEVVETAEAKKEKAQKKTIDSITNGLQQFSQLVGQTAGLVAQSYAFQLKQLEDTSKLALEQVVGDTEQANQKRLELEKQYQLQKAELEKRALIKSLQFQLVQAIADTAQAVVSNLEIPPLAIAIGVLGAAQIALIGQQLSYAQSLAGGGRIKMGAGGMVMGPSHEYGGVSYAGGVNLEGGESVINRQSSLNYAGLLSQINQSGGGQPLVNNASNSLMEERLVQAIAKANQQPIRAYVLNSEITSGQAINRRLNELATL